MAGLSLFEKFLYEAPDDDPPDTQPAEPSGPPDIPDGAENDPSPPDLPGGDVTDNQEGDLPPDMGGGEDIPDDGGFEDMAEDIPEEEGNKDLGIDEKISAIMNMQLYQRFITLLSTISTQLSSIKNNSDVLYTLSQDSVKIVESLKKLDENIRLYINNSFINENYSKNLLFFNKCLNLLKLLNDVFDDNIRKGIKSM